RRPSLSINATAQGVRDQLSGISEAGTVTIAAQFTVPLLTGGANSSRVRAAKAAAARSRFETRDLERAVDQAIVTSWANLDAARRSLDASRKQVEAAEFAFEGTKLEQQLGTRSTIDVLNAEQELLEARLAAVNSRNSLERTSYELLAALGAFDAGSLQLPVDQYDPEGNSQEINGNRFPDGTARLTYP
ncbi:MAG: TolC family protein, partial [Hyphomonadaceae bacterium]|nr:TolC family protein [Hyphomonadaceae bacterium]